LKRLKQSTAVALALGMLFTAYPAVTLAEQPTAAAALTQEQAIEKVKSITKIPDGYKFQNAAYQESNGETTWSLSYLNDNPFSSGWINIMLDAKTGQLIRYSHDERDPKQVAQPISRDKAREIAKSLLQQHATDKINQLQEVDLPPNDFMKGMPSDLLQSFRFVRTVNGLPFTNDAVTIRLDGDGNLREYTFNWTKNIQFPEPKPTLTAVEAQMAFEKALDIQLQYQRVYKMYEQTEYKMVYGLWQSTLPLIDAHSGANIDLEGKKVDPRSAAFTPLTEKPGAPLTKSELTKEQALEMIKTHEISTEGYTLNNAVYQSHRDSASQTVWRFEFITPSADKGGIMMTVSIDAKTGELREVYRSNAKMNPDSFPENPALTHDQARDKAIEAIKKAVPTETAGLALDPGFNLEMGPNYGSLYRFRFVQLINGIPMQNSGYMVGINPTTGELDDFRQDGPILPDNVPYPDPKQAISKGDAVQQFVKKYNLTLQYLPIHSLNKSPYEPATVTGATLAYAPMIDQQVQTVNALTGEWLDPWGITPPESIKLLDIAGHWAEKQLRHMVIKGVFQADKGYVKPDEVVKRADMIRYLVLALPAGGRVPKEDKGFYNDVPRDNPHYEFIQEAAARKWLTQDDANFRPNDPITRAELADILVRALGYQKLSESKGTFIDKFDDVNPSDRYFGDIAVVNSLGLITAQNGLFSPSQAVNKAQAATILLRAQDEMNAKAPTYYY